MVDSTSASSGSYGWTIPNTPSSQCKVRISDASYLTLNSISTDVFELTTEPIPLISITSPVGGDRWQVGTYHTIKWISYNVISVKIEYSTDTGINWFKVTDSTSAALGHYSLIIPNTPSTQCIVRITDINKPNLSNINNGVFTITTDHIPTISINRPRGGENWGVGQVQDIRWESSYVNSVKIEYTTDNEITWNNIIDPTLVYFGIQDYAWTIPNTPSTQCKVRITDIADYTIKSTSDSVFTITLFPEITILSPNGGESWKVGETDTIKWTSSNVVNVKIE